MRTSPQQLSTTSGISSGIRARKTQRLRAASVTTAFGLLTDFRWMDPQDVPGKLKMYNIAVTEDLYHRCKVTIVGRNPIPKQMNIGFYAAQETFNNNLLVTTGPESDWGSDTSNLPFVLLVNKLRDAGHAVSTIDTGILSEYDKIIFIDYPEYKTTGRPNKYLQQLIAQGHRELYLLCLETPAVRPNNWLRENHLVFRKIFTWHDDFVDNKKYFRVYISAHGRSEKMHFDLSGKTKLCCLVARNRYSHDPNNLYSERIRAIRWFEKHQPQDFDLFGYGWDEIRFTGKAAKLNFISGYLKKIGDQFSLIRPIRNWLHAAGDYNYLRALAMLRYWGAPQYPSWRGPVKSKLAILQRYRFCICFENSLYPGWITEKIFDCFRCGCVPVYFGDSHVESHIPGGTFLDMRKFRSYEDLYTRMKNMPDSEFLCYIDNIRNFMNSESSAVFSSDHFAETIYSEIFDLHSTTRGQVSRTFPGERLS